MKKYEVTVVFQISAENNTFAHDQVERWLKKLKDTPQGTTDSQVRFSFPKWEDKYPEFESSDVEEFKELLERGRELQNKMLPMIKSMQLSEEDCRVSSHICYDVIGDNNE